MKKLIKLKNLDKMVLWINESPVDSFLSSKKLSFRIPTIEGGAFSCNQIDQLIVELEKPCGGICMYGLLGIKIERHNKQYLDIDFGLGDKDSRLFENSIIEIIESPRYGLPDNFPSILFEIFKEEMIARKIFFSGKIEICYGAYGDVSSNLYIFKKITKLIVFLLSNHINEELLIDYLYQNNTLLGEYL